MAILELTYDPAWAAVRIVVDGGMWPSSVDTIRIVRTAPGYPVIPVRGVEMLKAADGYWIGTDHEMPLNTQVQYTVTGFLGNVEVTSESATTSTLTPGQGLWLKAPGQPDLSRRVQVRAIGDVVSLTMGGSYQPATGGPAVAQWGAVAADTVALTVRTGNPRALGAMLRNARVILVQPEADPGIDPGWYFVSATSLLASETRVGLDTYPIRDVALALTATDVPAGLGVPTTGVSWATVMEQYATWQDVLDAVPTWFDLQKGA